MPLAQIDHRNDMVARLGNEVFDTLVIGAGVNGAVSTLCLSAKGVKTALIDKGDFAAFTSQESSSLAWGGIKYLEGFEFSLVWNLCRSRNDLVKKFPSQVKEIRFYVNLQKGFRKTRILVWLGTVLYWFMGRFATKAPRLLSRRTIKREQPEVNISKSQGGVEYSDCYFKETDTRFVFNFIKQAYEQNAAVANYVEAISFSKDEHGLHVVECLDHQSQKHFYIRARTIVNAAGPFVDRLNESLQVQTGHRHLFSKGVHLIVPKITSSDRILTFFADDGRMFFVVPMGERSCVGTTDTPVSQLPPQVEDVDRDFILSNINQNLTMKQPLRRSDIIAERCGVRPLAVEAHDQASSGDWLKLSRKHVIEIDKDKKVISIFGGKLTDCLNVGQEIVDLTAELGIKIPNVKGEFQPESADMKSEFFQQAHLLGLAKEEADRLWRRYLSGAFDILKFYRSDEKLRKNIEDGYLLTWGELDYIASSEFVCRLEDILRRRSNLAQDHNLKNPVCQNLIKAIAERVYSEKAKDALAEYYGTFR